MPENAGIFVTTRLGVRPHAIGRSIATYCSCGMQPCTPVQGGPVKDSALAILCMPSQKSIYCSQAHVCSYDADMLLGSRLLLKLNCIESTDLCHKLEYGCVVFLSHIEMDTPDTILPKHLKNILVLMALYTKLA